MAAAAAPLAQPTSLQGLQFTAAALWTFVHLKVPSFTSEAAFKVVEGLQPKPDEDPKALARRLRKALSDAGISLKHTAALDAASRILGHSSWHACNREPAVPKLNLTMMVKAPEEQFLSWHELAPRLAEWLEAWHQVKPTKVFEVRFGPDFILICVPEPKKDSQAGETETVPALAINPIGEGNGWLTDAPAAFEMVRRRLEETGKAILDGVATLQICGRYGPDVLAKLPPMPQPVTPDDTCNSELVLLREDNELMPGDGFEIARGDEMTCCLNSSWPSKTRPRGSRWISLWRRGLGAWGKAATCGR
jgi:hypothetical protein